MLKSSLRISSFVSGRNTTAGVRNAPRIECFMYQAYALERMLAVPRRKISVIGVAP
jgi:hypothetical protein